MPTKDRVLLLKINEQIKKLSQPPLTTLSPLIGFIQGPTVYTSPVTPLPPLPPSKP